MVRAGAGGSSTQVQLLASVVECTRQPAQPLPLPLQESLDLCGMVQRRGSSCTTSQIYGIRFVSNKIS
jgi:hypothetical protein